MTAGAIVNAEAREKEWEPFNQSESRGQQLSTVLSYLLQLTLLFTCSSLITTAYYGEDSEPTVRSAGQYTANRPVLRQPEASTTDCYKVVAYPVIPWSKSFLLFVP